MKEYVDIHVVLATPADMEDNFDEPEEAAERINFILHCIYDRADEDVDTQLLDIEDDELLDWVDHTLATWDDADNEEDY